MDRHSRLGVWHVSWLEWTRWDVKAEEVETGLWGADERKGLLLIHRVERFVFVQMLCTIKSFGHGQEERLGETKRH